MAVCFLCHHKFSLDLLHLHFKTVQYRNNEIKKHVCGENSSKKSFHIFHSLKRHWLSNHQSEENAVEDQKLDSMIFDKHNGKRISSDKSHIKNSNEPVNSHNSTTTSTVNTNKNKNTNFQVHQDLQSNILSTSLKMYNTPAVSRKQVQLFFTSTISIINDELNTITNELLKLSPGPVDSIPFTTVTNLFFSIFGGV